jgi:PhzF family phenazine biosynthesis protein
MTLSLYQIDAFAKSLFKGNPAAVIPLEQWIDDNLMQQIAMENNLAETVFFVPMKNDQGNKDVAADYHIRWFTPTLEIDLCGHATLASAFVLYSELGFDKTSVRFMSKSGLLEVTKNGSTYEMDFPSWKPQKQHDYPENLAQILGIKEILGVCKYRDLLVEVATEAELLAANPDFTALKKIREMIILTAPGTKADFVSRFFAPGAGVDEDPVTGSAHSQLIPFWSDKLGKADLTAQQLSHRGGDLICKQLNQERVMMAGECVFYMKGTISL